MDTTTALHLLRIERRCAVATATTDGRCSPAPVRVAAVMLATTLLLAGCNRGTESAPASAPAAPTATAAPAATTPDPAPAAGTAAETPAAPPSPTDAGPAPGTDAPAPAPDAATAGLDAWLGDWTGPEGTGLNLAREPASAGTYRVSIRNLDGTERFRGVAMPGDPAAPEGSPLRAAHLTFERAGKLEHVVAGNGADTGMKWLADKRNCLVVTKGEGYCRG